MRRKWTVKLMTVVAILSLQGVAERIFIDSYTQEEYIAGFNKERMKIMEEHGLSHVKELTYDYGLAKIAETLRCVDKAPAGHRIFWTPTTDKAEADYGSAHLVYERLDEFMKTAHEDIDLALSQVVEFRELVDALSINQKRVGCAYKNCEEIVFGPPEYAGKYNYKSICVLGPKGTLTVEDLPFETRRVYWEREENKFEYYMWMVNSNRRKVMKDHGLANVKELTFDKGLAKKARTLSCSFTPPKGYRVFWAPRDKVDFDYSYGLMEKFLEIARKDINQGVNYLGKYPGLVETLSVNQERIGCAWKKCRLTSDGVQYTYSAICLLGPRGSLTAEDLPFQLHLHTRTSVYYDFESYVAALNEERKKIMDDHGVKGVRTLYYDKDRAWDAVSLPEWFDPPSRRAFRVPADAETAKYWYGEMDKFLEIAHRDVDMAIHHIANVPQLVETLQITQRWIVCVWRQSKTKTSGISGNHSAICRVGSERELEAESLPFRQGPPLPEEE